MLALALATVVAPSIAANHADHTYEFSEEFRASILASSHSVTRTHEYALSGLPKDTEITATLTWIDDPGTDLDLRLRGPVDSCDVFWPSYSCLVSVSRSRGGVFVCHGYTESLEMQDGKEQLTFVTDQPASWDLRVVASMLLPAVSVDYDLTLTVSEPHDAVTGPSPTTYLRLYGHCDAVQ